VIPSCNSTLWRPCAHCLFAATDRSARREKIAAALLGAT
jgi:hypothetical protein